MTESLMIKIVAGALFVGVPMLIAALLERLVRGVEIDTLRRAFWSLLAIAAALVIAVVALNPARSGSAELKTIGTIIAGVAIASVFAALIVARIVKGRQS